MRQCLVVDGALEALQPLQPVLQRAGFAPPTRAASLADALVAVRAASTELLLLPLHALRGGDRLELESVLRTTPTLAAVGTAPEPSAEVILDSMRAGIAEFLLYAAGPADLESAIQRLERRWAQAPVRGNVTAVFAPKGGLGATTIAVNLAHSLARSQHRRTVLMDLVLGLGDVALQLDMRPEYTVAELAEKVDRIDRDLLQSVATTGPDGLNVLAGTDRLDLAPMLSGEALGAMFSQCRQVYEETVVDCEHAFEPRTIATLDAADRVLLVAQLQVSSLVVARRALNVFRDLGYDDEKVRVVINREGSTNLVTLTEAQKVLARPIDARIPNDFAVTSDAQARGVPLLRHSPAAPIAKAFDALAASLLGSTASIPSSNGVSSNGAKRGRLFGLLRK
jgi:pilus assembly protein CpaE